MGVDYAPHTTASPPPDSKSYLHLCVVLRSLCTMNYVNNTQKSFLQMHQTFIVLENIEILWQQSYLEEFEKIPGNLSYQKNWKNLL